LALGLGLEAQVLGIGFDFGDQCHECSRWADTLPVDTRVPLEAVNDFYANFTPQTWTRQNCPVLSCPRLRFELGVTWPAGASARHDAVHRTFDMLMDKHGT